MLSKELMKIQENWNKAYTLSGWELVSSELSARSPIQEWVNELTVILTKASLISNIVEFTYKGKYRETDQIWDQFPCESGQ